MVVASVLALPLAALAAWLLTIWHRRGRRPALAWRRSLAEVGAVVGTLPWVWMILTPGPGPRDVHPVPLHDFRVLLHGDPAMAVAQIGGNLLVFAALGFCAPIRWAAVASLPRLLVLGAAGSVLVESLQYALNLGRVSSTGDVLLNAAGAVLAGLASRPWWEGNSGG